MRNKDNSFHQFADRIFLLFHLSCLKNETENPRDSWSEQRNLFFHIYQKQKCQHVPFKWFNLQVFLFSRKQTFNIKRSPPFLTWFVRAIAPSTLALHSHGITRRRLKEKTQILTRFISWNPTQRGEKGGLFIQLLKSYLFAYKLGERNERWTSQVFFFPYFPLLGKGQKKITSAKPCDFLPQFFVFASFFS